MIFKMHRLCQQRNFYFLSMRINYPGFCYKCASFSFDCLWFLNDFFSIEPIWQTNATSLTGSSSTHLEVQVSMRRIGDGTVLSGFVLKDGKATIEGYLPPKTNELQVKVNKQAFQLHEFREVRLSGIEIRETSPNEFTFMSQESNLAVKVMITDSSILNVATIPPLTLMDDLIGLLGNFDGNSTNDLCSKSESFKFVIFIKWKENHSLRVEVFLLSFTWQLKMSDRMSDSEFEIFHHQIIAKVL